MQKFRKKPVDAIQWQATNDSWEQIKSMGCPTKPGPMGSESFYIQTPEAVIHCKKWDWVVKDLNGEFSLCKPDVFEKTYEPA